MIQQHGAARARAPAMIVGDQTVNFGTLWERARRIAGGLADAGLKRGDRIAWLSKNHESAIELLAGAALAGIVLVPVNWRLAADEIAFILKDSEVRLIFASTEFLPLCRTLARELPRMNAVFCTNAPEGDDMAYASWREDRRVRVWPVPHPETIVLQLYTSGTTGRPKGAMLSHRALLASKPLWRDLDWYAWQKGDVALVAMPMFHIGGLGWALMALEAGMPSVIVPEFDVPEILRLTRDRAWTRTFIVPAALQAVIDHPDAAEVDFSAVRTILYGASPMPRPLLERAIARIGCDFAQQYGMTETCGTVVALTPRDHQVGGDRLDSAGQALPGVELAILDADGRHLPAGQSGQIAIRSIANMSGYWNRQEETARTLKADGWLLTGDSGLIDEDGYLFVLDRLNDMIITGGENVYPAEVESVLSAHPAVAEAAVIGAPDERWGEAVVAVVVIRPGALTSDAEIIAWMRDRIAAFKIPKALRRVDALPRNPSGKILRRLLRELVVAIPAGDA